MLIRSIKIYIDVKNIRFLRVLSVDVNAIKFG